MHICPLPHPSWWSTPTPHRAFQVRQHEKASNRINRGRPRLCIMNLFNCCFEGEVISKSGWHNIGVIKYCPRGSSEDVFCFSSVSSQSRGVLGASVVASDASFVASNTSVIVLVCSVIVSTASVVI